MDAIGAILTLLILAVGILGLEIAFLRRRVQRLEDSLYDTIKAMQLLARAAGIDVSIDTPGGIPNPPRIPPPTKAPDPGRTNQGLAVCLPCFENRHKDCEGAYFRGASGIFKHCACVEYLHPADVDNPQLFATAEQHAEFCKRYGIPLSW